jgi:hypothetical protein
VYPVSLLLIRTIVRYRVGSKIDIKSFHNQFHVLSYWGEQMKENRWAGHVARKWRREYISGFSVEV